MAVLQARAAADGLPLWRYLAAGAQVRLPLQEIQIFGGGAHAARRVDVQDFMVVCPAANSFAEALDWTAALHRLDTGKAVLNGERRHFLSNITPQAARSAVRCAVGMLYTTSRAD